MESNDDAIKLTKKEYYRAYQNKNRNEIRENCRRYYKNKVVNEDYRLELNRKTLENRHNRLIRNGLEIKAKGRPRKNK